MTFIDLQGHFSYFCLKTSVDRKSMQSNKDGIADDLE